MEFSDRSYPRVADAQKLANSRRKPILVHLANILTRTFGLSHSGDDGLDLAEVESARLLGLGPDILKEIARQTKELVDASANMF